MVLLQSLVRKWQKRFPSSEALLNRKSNMTEINGHLKMSTHAQSTCSKLTANNELHFSRFVVRCLIGTYLTVAPKH